MKASPLTLAALFLAGAAALVSASALAGPEVRPAPGPVFEDAQHTLRRPEGHREWFFVGSSIGLSYPERAEPREPAQERFHNVYIDPAGYREFRRTGKFPEGTMFALEQATSAQKREPGLQGAYEKDIVSLSFSVKDSGRFRGGWAYYNFSGPDGRPLARARPNPPERCETCHAERAATDHVFSQFYPLLRAAAPR